MKIKFLTLLFVLAWTLAACSPAAPGAPVSENTDAAPASTTAPSVFKTPIGDLVFDSARFVAEANSTTPAEGCNLLLVGLRRPDGSSIDLGQFQEAQMPIFIRDTDDLETLSTMGGLVDGQFVIGFQAPKTMKSYHLVWGENPPLEIHPAE